MSTMSCSRGQTALAARPPGPAVVAAQPVAARRHVERASGSATVGAVAKRAGGVGSAAQPAITTSATSDKARRMAPPVPGGGTRPRPAPGKAIRWGASRPPTARRRSWGILAAAIPRRAPDMPEDHARSDPPIPPDAIADARAGPRPHRRRPDRARGAQHSILASGLACRSRSSSWPSPTARSATA